MQQRIILIPGMHRSGTSLVTRLLNLHGASIPIERVYEDEFNIKGYWESFEFQHINDKILSMGDSNWFDVRAFDEARFRKLDTANIEELANQFLQKMLSSGEEYYVLKDPRICRLLSIWRQRIESVGATPLCVIPFRHPLSVAASINNRDSFSVDYSLNLWLRNVLEAEKGSRGLPRVFIEYANVLSNWRVIFNKISVKLELQNLKDCNEIEEEVTEFISPDLAHWTFDRSEINLIEGIGEACGKAYRYHCKLEQHYENDSILELLDSLRATINDLDSPQQLIVRAKNSQNAKTSDMLEEHFKYVSSQLSKLEASQKNKKKLENKIEQLENRQSELGQRNGKLETEIASLKGQKQELRQLIKPLQEELQGLTEQLKRSKASLGSTQKTVRKLRGEKHSVLKQLEKRQTSIDTLQAVSSYRRAKALKLKLRLDTTETKLAQNRNHFESLMIQKNAIEESLTNQVRGLHQQAQDLSSAYLEIKNSISWRISKPIRLLIGIVFILPITVLKKLTGKTAPQPQLEASPEFPPEIQDEPVPDLSDSGTGKQASFPPTTSSEPHPIVQLEMSARSHVSHSLTTEDASLPVKLIAFYLPQFHRIPENDNWWGKGFTEWSNVRPAKPIFEGHYQPRVPGELGHYDLEEAGVQKRQIELAKNYGLGGFCFYFYWFQGERLLETPILNYLEDKSLDFPFCICWANENWTRTWDGQAENVLIGQDHSPDDDIAFIKHVAQYMRDSRYIRVTGKPLLLVYRPSLLPNSMETSNGWRKWCRDNGIGEIYLAYTQSFELNNPADFGFDAAIEFPPNNTAPEVITDNIETLDADFEGIVYNWNSVAQTNIQKRQPDYQLFKGVAPGWDNTARRPRTGAVFAGSSPQRYREWLEFAVAQTVESHEEPSERLVFINAWNEWAEGAYLEPDEVYGYAYLEATREALEDFTRSKSWEISARQEKKSPEKIVLVAHDAHPHGAQYLSLNLARVLSSEFGFQVDMVVLGEGILIEQYKQWATVHELAGVDPKGTEARQLAEDFFAKGHTAAICNTTVSGLFLETLSKAGLRCVSLVHELPEIIRSYQLEQHAETLARHAQSVVCAVPQVAQSLQQFGDTREEQIVIRPQGLYKVNRFRNSLDTARRTLRSELELEPDARIVLGVGFLDHRKGVDLFVKAGFRILETVPDCHMVWVGYWNADMQREVETLLDEHPLRNRFLFTGHRHDTDLFYAGADVFALPSREDPFPSTVMEALEVQVPVVAFRGAGGAEILLDRGCGLLAAFEQVDDYADCIVRLLENPAEARQLGETGAGIVARELSFRHYVFDLLDLLGHPQKRVSAIVPNYNYAHYLEERIASVGAQSHPVFELIVIDDGSTDDSIEVIQKALAACPVPARLIVNDENSGSVFAQWKRGVEEARCDYVWICEADDTAEPGFLRKLIGHFDDPEVVFAYSQSRQIDRDGDVIQENYLDYTNDVDPAHWLSDFVTDGRAEISRRMAVKNCIPNVSAVVFRKDLLRRSLDDCWPQLGSLKVAGDWLIYVQLLSRGKVGYCAESLNAHRRHDSSVTISKRNNEVHMAEIHFMQDFIARNYPVNEETRLKARAFVEHACHHLELDPNRTYALNIPESDNSAEAVSPAPFAPQARAIAFYLPQFHPIPENDRWWGKGFTEWANVSKATPQFEGHRQPQLPTDLGFYDLRLEETRMQQAELARQHGIEGFCYWHYWFNGKRLLERPFNEVLRSGKPDFPFCLAWANESWSRRWLGEEKGVLMAQTYSAEDDREHAHWLADAFTDPRYIRIRNRPLFLVYRPTDLPDPRRIADTLKEACVRRGLPEPFLVGINGHDRTLDSKTVGFDATLHFMPQLGVLPDAFTDGPLPSRKERNAGLGIENEVTKVYDYEKSLKQMLDLRDTFGHETIPSIFVGWDNTPRRGENAIVMVGHSQEAYQRALRSLVDDLRDRPENERLLFINAWNEWAEGNHLEPDQVDGKGFLEATREALAGADAQDRTEGGIDE